MFGKIGKITFWTGKKYFVFVFFWVFLSLFSYVFGNNIIVWVQNYLMEQVKPLLGWDVVVSPRDDAGNIVDLQKYSDVIEWASTIELNTTLFDANQNPRLYEAVFHSENYPFYNAFEYEILNPSGTLIVDQNTYDIFGENIEVFGNLENVKGVITKSPLWELSMYASENKIYLSLELFPADLDFSNARLDYDYYGKFYGEYDENIVKNLKQDPNLEKYRVRSIEDRNENISEITDRFYVYINFFHLIIFILTFFIVILSLESYFKKIKSTLGTLNIFWMTKSKIIFYNSVFLWGVFLLGFLLALASNVFIFYFLSQSYEFLGIFWESIWKWAGVTGVLFLVGIFSPFYKMYYSQVGELVNDTGNIARFTWREKWLYGICMFAGFFVIQTISGIIWYDAILYAFLSFIFLGILYVIVSKILVFSFEKFFKKVKNFYIFDAIRSTIKPWNVSFFILFSSIISFLSVFVFFVFSGSFVNYLNTLTQESRDMFIINVQQKDIEEVEKYFTQDEIYEIVTLRIAKINGIALNEFLHVENVPREFGREFYSTTSELQNPIVRWQRLSDGWVSVDDEFATRLWLKIWDSIEFGVAGLPIVLEVQNIRSSERAGTNPFFYFQLMKNDFERYPKTYILSYKQSDKELWLEQKLNRHAWGTLTIINTKDIIEIVWGIAAQILQVVYVCFAYIFVFSFLSFIVCLTFLQSFKEYKTKLLNILWWNKKRLLWAIRFEYIYLLLIWAGLSVVTGSVILTWIFYFIEYFSLHIFSYFLGILLVIGWVGVMSGYLFLGSRK